jgi:hypothetical protein
MSGLQRFTLRSWLVMAAALIALQALALHLTGGVAYCTCGYIKLWEGDVASSGNSQHISDWYSFSHVIHGFIFCAALWLVRRHWPVGLRFVLAVAVEASWEILENTSAVIDHYRAATISLNYCGDADPSARLDQSVAAGVTRRAGVSPVRQPDQRSARSK